MFCFELPCLACLACLCFSLLACLLALNCFALLCLALHCSCLALPCLALPCLALPCLALPCLACALIQLVWVSFVGNHPTFMWIPKRSIPETVDALLSICSSCIWRLSFPGNSNECEVHAIWVCLFICGGPPFLVALKGTLKGRPPCFGVRFLQHIHTHL